MGLTPFGALTNGHPQPTPTEAWTTAPLEDPAAQRRCLLAASRPLFRHALPSRQRVELLLGSVLQRKQFNPNSKLQLKICAVLHPTPITGTLRNRTSTDDAASAELQLSRPLGGSSSLQTSTVFCFES